MNHDLEDYSGLPGLKQKNLADIRMRCGKMEWKKSPLTRGMSRSDRGIILSEDEIIP